MEHTLRRLSAKCARTKVQQSAREYLAPFQLGYGTPCGTEAAAHASHRYLHNILPGHATCMLKLDFKNAFNCAGKDKFVKAVEHVIPTLYSFVHSSAYKGPSLLFCGDNTLSSAEGVQQGDPVGPLLFCLAIHPQAEVGIQSLLSGLWNYWRQCHLIEQEASILRLELNQSKSELICEDLAVKESMLLQPPGLQETSSANANILGSPIRDLASVGGAIQAKTNQLQIMGGRLGSLCSHDALLLRHSFSAPKVLYILRTAPSFLSTNSEDCDCLLRSTLSDILNISLDDESAWTPDLPPGECRRTWHQKSIPACSICLPGLCCRLLRFCLPAPPPSHA